MQFGLQSNAVRRGTGRTDRVRWSSMNESGPPRPELLMRVGLGSHAGSHRDEQPRGSPDSHGQRVSTRPRSRTDLNGSGRQHMELRISPWYRYAAPYWRVNPPPYGLLVSESVYLRVRRLGVRVPPSAPRIRRSGAIFSGVRGGPHACLRPCLSQSLTTSRRYGGSWPAPDRLASGRHRSHGRRSSS